MIRKHTSRTVTLLAVITTALSLAATAQAQSGDDTAPKPWYRGVSDTDQERAKTLFTEGVALHKQLFYSDAIAKYQQALTHWDHPDIHYNLARAHISLGQSIDAYNELLASMKYGKISLTEEDWATAQEYKTLLEAQIARIEVSCAIDGAVVTVDDKELFRGPGKKELLVLPGPHRVSATKAEHQDADEWLQVNPGERKRVELTPMSLALISRLQVSCDEPDAAVILDGAPLMACPGTVERIVPPGTPLILTISRPGRITAQQTLQLKPGQRMQVALQTQEIAEMVSVRRWQPWKQWAVMGTGAGLGVLGGLLQWQAVSEMDSFNSAFTEICGDEENPLSEIGCLPGEVPQVIDKRDRATLLNRAGVGLMVIGGVVLVGGVTMALLNQSRLVSAERASAISVTPTVGPRTAGVLVGGSF